MTPHCKSIEGMAQSRNLNVHKMFMGGVDFNDQVIQPYLATRIARHPSTRKSPLISLIWQFIIMLSTVNPLKDLSYSSYQEEIIPALLYQEGPPESIQSDAMRRCHKLNFPDKIPPRKTGQKHKNNVWYAPELEDTPFIIVPSCLSQPGLCIGDCFHRYHPSMQYY